MTSKYITDRIKRSWISQVTTEWQDTDLASGDGEVTILELGAVAGTVTYKLENSSTYITTNNGTLTYKLYVEIYDTARELTDEAIAEAGTGARSLFAGVVSRYIKVTVTASADNNDLEASLDHSEANQS